MLVPISEIKVNPGRREAKAEDIQELADSIAEIGLLNPITVDSQNVLIAGLHRLEAMKLLGRTKIECTVSGLEGLQAELAEIDENFVRSDLSTVDYGNLLLRRKEIYETLHPDAKHGGDRSKRTKCPLAPTRSFVDDTAEKLGVDPRTVRREIQTAKNLTPEAKEIIRSSDTKISKKDALELSRLAPEQQGEAASQLAEGLIQSIDEYRSDTEKPSEQGEPSPEVPSVPYTLGSKHYASFAESIADLKNHDKDCSYTPDTLLADMDGFVQRFHKDFSWYSDPFCTVIFPNLSPAQFTYIQQLFATISSAMEDLLHQIERKVPS